MAIYTICIIIGYLLGSVNFAVILSKGYFHKDVRDYGSLNAGATNMTRVFGFGAGGLTFLGDFLKCWAAMAIGMKLGGTIGWMLGGIGCLIGHCFPIFFQFRGGKAVSTGAAVAFLADIRVFLLVMAVWALVVLATRIVSVASMAGGLSFGLFACLFHLPVSSVVLGIFTGLLIVVMHRSNIRRLCRGTESRFHRLNQ